MTKSQRKIFIFVSLAIIAAVVWVSCVAGLSAFAAAPETSSEPDNPTETASENSRVRGDYDYVWVIIVVILVVAASAAGVGLYIARKIKRKKFDVDGELEKIRNENNAVEIGLNKAALEDRIGKKRKSEPIKQNKSKPSAADGTEKGPGAEPESEPEK